MWHRGWDMCNRWCLLTVDLRNTILYDSASWPSFQRNDFCANNMGDIAPTTSMLAKITKRKLNGCIETTKNDHTYFQILLDFRPCLEMPHSWCFLCHQFLVQGSVSLVMLSWVTCQLFQCPPRPPAPNVRLSCILPRFLHCGPPPPTARPAVYSQN